MATATDRIAVTWEHSYPVLLGAGAGLGALALSPRFFVFAEHRGWVVENIYLSVFELSLVFTAFCVTFYTFLITAESGFIGRIRASIFFKQLLAYIVHALAAGGVLIVFSIPMLVIVPSPDGDAAATTIVVSLWTALAVGTVAAFFRAAHLFAIVAAEQH